MAVRKVKAPTKSQINRAVKLIESEAHKGNHGFVARELDLWRAERKLFLKLLRMIRDGTRPSCDQMDAAENAQCPRFGSGNYNEDHGTVAGEQWVERCKTLIYDAYDAGW